MIVVVVVPSGRTNTLMLFCDRPIVLTQEGEFSVNDVCKCVHD